MKTPDYRPMSFEASLSIDSPVVVCWTSCGAVYKCKGVISKIYTKSFRVKLTEICKPYPEDQEIIVPRMMGAGWSVNNRVEPVR